MASDEDELELTCDTSDLYGDLTETDCLQLFTKPKPSEISVQPSAEGQEETTQPKISQEARQDSHQNALVGNEGQKKNISPISTAGLRQRMKSRFSNDPRPAVSNGNPWQHQPQSFNLGSNLTNFQNNLGTFPYQNRFNIPPYFNAPFQAPFLQPNFPKQPSNFINMNLSENFISFDNGPSVPSMNRGFGNAFVNNSGPNFPKLSHPGPPYGTYEPNLSLGNSSQGPDEQRSYFAYRNRLLNNKKRPVSTSSTIEPPAKISIKDRLSPTFEYISPLRSPPANLPCLRTRAVEDSDQTFRPPRTPVKPAKPAPETPVQGSPPSQASPKPQMLASPKPAREGTSPDVSSRPPKTVPAAAKTPTKPTPEKPPLSGSDQPNKAGRNHVNLRAKIAEESLDDSIQPVKSISSAGMAKIARERTLSSEWEPTGQGSQLDKTIRSTFRSKTARELTGEGSQPVKTIPSAAKTKTVRDRASSSECESTGVGSQLDKTIRSTFRSKMTRESTGQDSQPGETIPSGAKTKTVRERASSSECEPTGESSQLDKTIRSTFSSKTGQGIQPGKTKAPAAKAETARERASSSECEPGEDSPLGKTILSTFKSKSAGETIRSTFRSKMTRESTGQGSQPVKTIPPAVKTKTVRERASSSECEPTGESSQLVKTIRSSTGQCSQPGKTIPPAAKTKTARVRTSSSECDQLNENAMVSKRMTRLSSSSSEAGPSSKSKTLSSSPKVSPLILRKGVVLSKTKKVSIDKNDEPKSSPSPPQRTTRAQAYRLRKKKSKKSPSPAEAKTPERRGQAAKSSNQAIKPPPKPVKSSKISQSTKASNQSRKTPETNITVTVTPVETEASLTPAELALKEECQRTVQLITSMGSPGDDTDEDLFIDTQYSSAEADDADRELVTPPPPPNISDYLASLAHEDPASPVMPARLISPSPSMLSDMVPTPQSRQSAKLRLGNYVDDNATDEDQDNRDMSREPVLTTAEKEVIDVVSDAESDDIPLIKLIKLEEDADSGVFDNPLPKVVLTDCQQDIQPNETTHEVHSASAVSHAHLDFVPGGPISTELKLFSRNPFLPPPERIYGKPKSAVHPFLDENLQVFLFNLPTGVGDMKILEYCKQLCSPRGFWKMTDTSVILFFHTRIARDWFVRFANETPIAQGVIADMPVVDLSLE